MDFSDTAILCSRPNSCCQQNPKCIQVCRFSVLNALKRTVCLVLNHVL